MDRKGISAVIATVLMLVITIALASTTYIYSTGILTTATQGVEVVDNFCDSNSYVTAALRNLGTNPVTNIQCLQTAPSGDTCSSSSLANADIAPGSIQTFSNFDQCLGSGSRFCQYRLTPNAGRTIVFQVQCSGTTGSTGTTTTTSPPAQQTIYCLPSCSATQGTPGGSCYTLQTDCLSAQTTTTTTAATTTTTTAATTTTTAATTTTTTTSATSTTTTNPPTTTTTTTTTTISLPSGIYDYWKFDDGSGPIATDGGPNGIFGQLFNYANSVTWVTNGTCRSVNCLGFNGSATSSVYLDMGTDSRLELMTPTNSFTIVAWIKAPPAGAIEYLVDNIPHSTATDAGYSFYIDASGNLNGYVGNGTKAQTITVISNVTTKSWQQVALVVDMSEGPNKGNMTIYQNGTQIGLNASLSAVNGSRTNIAPFRIGVTSQNSPASPFKGMMDEVMIYDRALIPSEIASLYSSFAPVGSACCAGNNGVSASCTSTNGASSWTINGVITNFCDNVCSSYGKSCVPFSVCTGSSGDSSIYVKGYALASCAGNSNSGSSCQSTGYNSNPSAQCCCR